MSVVKAKVFQGCQVPAFWARVLTLPERACTANWASYPPVLSQAKCNIWESSAGFPSVVDEVA
mgnify:FL=1